MTGSETSYQRLITALALLAAAIGVVTRVVAFGDTPPGLNQDEASIGYDAWSVLTHGIDRNGVAWPVHFVAWGSGQNALYGYLAMPFIAALGLTPTSIRLPMLIAGLLSLPLAWVVGRRLFGATGGLGALVAVSLSPWHVMLSRWALESNLLPFLFLCAFALVTRSVGDNGAETDRHRSMSWLAGMLMLAVCLYAYGTAYLAIPVYLLGACGLAVWSKALSWRVVALGLGLFALVSVPIGIFVAVNMLQWDTVTVAGISMPLLPGSPRFQSEVANGAGWFTNAKALVRLLLTQSDGTPFNVTDPYGVMYSVAFVILAAGSAVAAFLLAVTKRYPPHRALLGLWILACIPTGIVQGPNINRINLLLLGLVVAGGCGLALVDARFRGSFAAMTVALLVAFGLFARDYFTTQRTMIAPAFFDGLVPALRHAQVSTDDAICVSDRVNMPYIYALFTERTDPRDFLRTVVYENASAPLRRVRSFGRYTFGLERCNLGSLQAMVARIDEPVPVGFIHDASYSYFAVFVRR